MTTRIPREEIIAILGFAIICLIVGAIGGYTARSVTARDRWLISTAVKQQSEAEYYQKQLNELVDQEKQRRVK